MIPKYINRTFPYTKLQIAENEFVTLLCRYESTRSFNKGFTEPLCEIPDGFVEAGAEVFDNTWCIGYDDDDITFKVNYETYNLIPDFDTCSDEERVELEKCRERGERTRSKIMIFNKNNPNQMKTALINMWKRFYSIDSWFRHIYRPNRIFISDYDGFKIFDFELNLLYFKPVKNSTDVYGFFVDLSNWNNVWVWSFEDAKSYLENKNIQRETHQLYSNMDDMEEISEYIIT